MTIPLFFFLYLAVDCGSPPVVENSQVSAPLTTFQSMATYECDRGYEFSTEDATMALECQASGAWSDPPPSFVCQRKLLSTAHINDIVSGAQRNNLVAILKPCH